MRRRERYGASHMYHPQLLFYIAYVHVHIITIKIKLAYASRHMLDSRVYLIVVKCRNLIASEETSSRNKRYL